MPLYQLKIYNVYIWSSETNHPKYLTSVYLVKRHYKNINRQCSLRMICTSKNTRREKANSVDESVYTAGVGGEGNSSIKSKSKHNHTKYQAIKTKIIDGSMSRCGC